jgi:hypothetical protein
MSWDRIVLWILFAPFILGIAFFGWTMLIMFVRGFFPDRPVRRPTKEDYIRECEELKK